MFINTKVDCWEIVQVSDVNRLILVEKVESEKILCYVKLLVLSV